MLETVGIVTGFEDVAVMGETIQEGGGHLGITKDLNPFAEGQIGGDDEAGPFVKLADQPPGSE